MLPTSYVLPTSPSFRVEDRFSIFDGDEPTVPFWDIFSVLLDQEVHTPKALVDLLETLAVLLRGTAETDYAFLLSYLDQNLRPEFWTTTWPLLKHFALKMPILFPTNSIPILSSANSKLILSRAQIACLVVHQFLCTLAEPVWQQGFHDFDLWYGSQQPHPSAVHAYLTALFTYFDRLSGVPETSLAGHPAEEWPIVYELAEDHSGFDRDTALRPVVVLRLPEATTAPDVLGLPSGAAVVSANKYIGFGRTGTQEETHVGASPEACPAVLFTPPLQDDQVLVVAGAEAMISIRGYGRDAHCGEILKLSETRSANRTQWATRTMIFMDALELDLSDQSLGTPVDLQPGNVERDLKKAYVGFKHKCKASIHQEPPMIFTGFWGCRTFGGDPEIKACIQWCAASLAGNDLTFICSDEQQHRFADRFEAFISEFQADNVSAKDLRSVLLYLRPEDIETGASPFTSIIDRLMKRTKLASK